MSETTQTVDEALAKGYALYMSRVDYRDSVKRDDPERRLAQLAVEVAWEMYHTISTAIRPPEPGNASVGAITERTEA